ncbi:hypothetical protein NPIL_239881 [Nephila pilipes]|uniref:Uncharacterized protein n=1 Tax=Nephila pilipes TaxID=299642 RepID=A0A8X6NNW6_NEPPI|nr:hypothetical protein NPIL_239881 [Nephila pilipes]
MSELGYRLRAGNRTSSTETVRRGMEAKFPQIFMSPVAYTTPWVQWWNTAHDTWHAGAGLSSSAKPLLLSSGTELGLTTPMELSPTTETTWATRKVGSLR